MTGGEVDIILEGLVELVEYAESLTYQPPAMAASKRCPDSSAGSPCYDEWCIKNNDCFDYRARTQ